MFGIGTEELVLILVIALVVLGPERMPKLARDLGRMVGDFRRTSDELRNEFLNADAIIDAAAKSGSPPAIAAPDVAPTSDGAAPAGAASLGAATPMDVGVPLSGEALLQPGETAPATEADVATAPVAAPEPSAATNDGVANGAAAATVQPETTNPLEPPDPEETHFDREAREARARLEDPARARQAAAEGWATPTDEAGTSDRWG